MFYNTVITHTRWTHFCTVSDWCCIIYIEKSNVMFLFLWYFVTNKISYVSEKGKIINVFISTPLFRVYLIRNSFYSRNKNVFRQYRCEIPEENTFSTENFHFFDDKIVLNTKEKFFKIILIASRASI